MALETIQFRIVLATNDDEQYQKTSVDLVPDSTLGEMQFLVPVKTFLTLQFPIVLATNDDEQPQEISLDLVPDDIHEEILSWIPTKTLLHWKTVSKPWLRMLDNPVFARKHFSRAPFCPLLIFRDSSSSRSSRIMYLVEGQSVSDLDPNISKSKLVSRFDFDTQVAGPSRIRHRFLPENKNAISCEGVVCWILHDHPDGHYIFICNSVTGEYVSLSPLPMDEVKFYVFVGIGFCRGTKKFELLRMPSRLDYDDDDDDDDEVSRWWPEVRTLGDRRWRRVGDGAIKLDFFREIWQVVYVNGAIYWNYYGDSIICSYHFERAIFEAISLPQTNSFALEYISLGVLADSLCLSLVSSNDGHVELWILKNDGVSEVKWNKLYDIETMTTYLDHSGSLLLRGQYKVIKYLQRGEILMHDCRGMFIIYDPITKVETHLRVLRDSCLEDLRKDRFGDMQVVPHVPCLVNLKEALNTDEEEVSQREPVG